MTTTGVSTAHDTMPISPPQPTDSATIHAAPTHANSNMIRPAIVEPITEQPRALRVRTLDERLSLWGSVFAALASVWIIYEGMLAWSGILGFLFCWWAVFLLFYATATGLSNPRPVVIERLASAIIGSGAATVALALGFTMYFIAFKGIHPLLHANFYTQDMAGVRPTSPLTRGGVLHAVWGSAIQIAIATGISLPLGIGTAVYMTEVGGRLAKIVRTVVEAMTALPDILAGLFVYTVLIIELHWDRTGLAAALALSVTMVPIIARSAEVVLRVVPGGLREAGEALGASQWQTVRRVVLPTARSGLATALILGIARIAGETAPLLIVSGASTFTNLDPLSNPMNSLPLFVYTAVRSGEPLFIERGYGAALLLLGLVITLFAFTRFLARDKVRSR
jgi:phosphate transport system permease protein